jgi:hypothetical protein
LHGHPLADAAVSPPGNLDSGYLGVIIASGESPSPSLVEPPDSRAAMRIVYG